MPKAIITYPSDIVNRNGNGGWHRKGKRAYRKAVLTILQCLQTYKEARLYHLCFEGKSHKKQVKMLNALVQMADRAGIKCEWFAARETADKTKVDHLHCFMVIDAYGIKVAKVFNQFDDGQVGRLCAKHGVNFSIFSPKDDLGIHGRNTYMALPYQGPENRETELGRKRLADALVWLTYNFKARSKPLEAEADGQIFPASRPNRKRIERTTHMGAGSANSLRSWRPVRTYEMRCMAIESVEVAKSQVIRGSLPSRTDRLLHLSIHQRERLRDLLKGNLRFIPAQRIYSDKSFQAEQGTREYLRSSSDMHASATQSSLPKPEQLDYP